MTHALTTRADTSKPYGDVTYADPGYQADKQKRYPLDSEAHCRAAWSYINMPKNASQYTAEQLAAVKGRIKAAAKRYGIQIADEQNSADLNADARGWTESLHPRVPAGSSGGGQFGDAPKAKGHAATGRRPHVGSSSSGRHVLAYDPHSNSGPGYDTKNGDPDVKTLQDNLNRLGLTDDKGHKLAVDGKLGPLTTQSVKAAQKRLGLTPDGRVTHALFVKLAGANALPGRSFGMLDLCVRSFGFEFEQRAAGDGRTLEGYAAVFDAPTKIRDVNGDFEETILPNAFKRSLALRTPILQWDHGKDPRIGTAPIGSIENLSEDSRGLHVRARLFDHPDIERVRLAIEARAVTGMSFRFGVPEGGDEWPSRDKRNIRDADVHELGPVAFPAYDTTTVSVRSLLAQLDPDEHRALIRELAAEVRLAVDLSCLTGRPDAWSAGGGDPDTEPGNGDRSSLSNRQRLDEGALRLRGILN